MKNSKSQRSSSRRLHAALIEAMERRVLLSANVLNYHNDTASTGLNNAEIQLTTANVKTGSFGKVFTTPLDGQVYAQPLVDSSVNIAGGTNTVGATGVHNVVFVATENDSIYAIDGSINGGAVLWKRSFLTANAGGNQNNTLNASSINLVNTTDVSSSDISPTLGITGTPVIDGTTNLMYVVVLTKEVIGGTTYFIQRLHAIKLSDGTDAAAPFVIGQTTTADANTTPIYAYGTGDGSVTDPYNGTGKKVVQFDALREHQRAALSLVNGNVYVAWASHGDNGPYHGWVVAWNVANIASSGFQLKGVFCSSPNDGEAGIWQGGGEMAFEPDGSAFYFLTGNGTGGPPTVGSNGLPTDANYNEALVKAQLDPTTSATNQGPNGWGIKAVDYFIPYNVAALDGADSDFGSGAPILLPPSAGIPGHPNLIVVGGKDGRLFVIDRNNLGHYSAGGDAVLNAVPNSSGIRTAPTSITGLLSAPAYYNGKLYAISGYSGAAYAFTIGSTGALSTVSQVSGIQFGNLSGGPSVSANANTNGIVWMEDRNLNELHAYDANTLNTELWNSSQAAGGSDNPGALVKFNVPTVANGEVYLGTSNSLVVYGLTPPAGSPPAIPVLSATALSGSSVNLTWTDSSVAPNLATNYLVEDSTDGTNFTEVTTAPANATSLAVGGLSNLTKYYFRIQGLNAVGSSQFSNIVNATTTSTQTTSANFSGGFAASSGLMTLTGSAIVNGSALQLTDQGFNENASAFFDSPFSDSGFNSQFTFQLNGIADGITFTLQNAGLSAIGSNGGGLGYGPNPGGGQSQSIGNSVAIKFDLYNNSGEGSDSTGLYVNGAVPTTAGSIDLSSTGIDLHSGHIFQVTLAYNGATLTTTIKDTTTGASATQNYTVNIPSVIGSPTAFAGFTAGTGGSATVQRILTWTYTAAGSTTSPNTPLGLGATPASATSVSLNWTAASSNQSGYHLDRATNSAFTQNLLTETLPATPASFTDVSTGLAPGQTFYYRLRAFNSAGDSGNSNAVSVTIPVAPPKPTNQSITDVDNGEIDMSWQDNAGNTAQGYNILRAVNHGSFAIYATLPPTSRPAPSTYTWSDTNVTPGSYYEYHIEAYNVSGNNDFAGVNATAITNPPAVTATPVNGGVNLSWNAPTGAVSYNVYRGSTAGGESTTPIATGVTATTYSDPGLTNGTSYFYEVTAVNANAAYTPPLPSESDPSVEVSAIPGTTVVTTSPLSDADIGGPGVAGSASLNSSTSIWTISGSGADIWNAGDQFNFASTTVTGDSSIVAEVTSLTNTDPWAKAGLMYRDGSAANAANVALVATAGNGVSFQWRTAAGGGSNYTSNGLIPAPTAATPLWLKLTRAGNVFTASYSTNGTTYTVLGTQTIAMSNALLGGLAITSHNNGVLGTATFANVAIPVSGGGGGTTVTPPATPALTATAAAGAVNLSWAAVSGATSYTLYRSTTSGGEGTTAYQSNLTGTTYSDTAVTSGTPYYYTLAAVNSAGPSAQSVQASATPTGTVVSSGPLADADIGAPGKAGSASLNSSTSIWTISGSGADIWNAGDQFNFASTTVTGDSSIVAEVTSLTNTDPWAKAGLMYRDGSAANAANVALVATAGNGVSFQWRTAAGGGSNYTSNGLIPAPTAATPLWLKLTRAGNVFTASYSTNGTTYTVLGTQTIAMSNALLGGLAITSHNNGVLGTATFANVAIPVSGGGGGTTVTPPATPALTATAAAGAVNLSWAAVSGATSYTLYRSTTSGGEGTTAYQSNLTGTTYSDTAVTSGTPYYYTLAAVNSAGPSAQSVQASATPTGTVVSSGPLADADIGAPGKAGSASLNSSTSIWTISGSGADIWNAGDQFNFASTTVTGDSSIVAEVTSLTNTDPWAKAGLMYRDGSAANAANVALVATAGNGVSFQWRTAAGGGSNYTSNGLIPAPTAATPLWLKLTRAGNVFTASYSTNGTTYTVLGTQTIAMSNALLGGLAITSHNNGVLGTATFANVAIPVSGGGGGTTVTPPATPALTATAAAGAVNLSWAAVSGATSYTLYRSTTSGGEGTTAYQSNLTGTTYSDTAVTSGTPYYYTLAAVNSAGPSAQSVQASATPTGTVVSSGPLADADIGAPGKAGSASLNSSTSIWTISGSGADIWLNSDQFNFASMAVAGNATLTTEVTSLTGTDGWTKAGLMFRDGSAANAPNVAVFVTPANGISFQWRLYAGDSSASVAIPGIPMPAAAAPIWLQLTRAGNIFTASYSTNGVNYTVVGSQTVSMSNSLSAGLAVTAHNNSLLATATFANTIL